MLGSSRHPSQTIVLVQPPNTSPTPSRPPSPLATLIDALQAKASLIFSDIDGQRTFISSNWTKCARLETTDLRQRVANLEGTYTPSKGVSLIKQLRERSKTLKIICQPKSVHHKTDSGIKTELTFTYSATRT